MQKKCLTCDELITKTANWCMTCRKKVLKVKSTTHGASRKHKHNFGAYKAWVNARVRSSELYMAIEESWKFSFENFLKDMGEYKEGYHLTRLNKKLGFTKDNCRWIKLTIIER